MVAFVNDSSVPVLFGAALDKKVKEGCMEPGCMCKNQPIMFGARCCGGGVNVSYFGGVLRIVCEKCGEPVCAIAVKDGP